MEKLVWKTVQRRVDDLLPYSKNPRVMSDKQLDNLQRSLRKYNLVELPAVDVDGKIVAGHQRIRALQLLGRGQEEIEVRVPNRKLTDKEYEGYLLTSNAVTGDWNYEMLKDFDFDLLLDVGFDTIELGKFWDNGLEVEDDDFDQEKEIEKIKNPQTKRGDIILLGEHKLICGDSTDPEVLRKLFGEERASMIYSDPIYNLKIDNLYNGGIGGKQNYGGQVDDNKTDEEYREFIKKSLIAALGVLQKDAHIFYWSDQRYIWMIQTLYRELGVDNKRVCLWIKNGQNPTPNIAFSKCYEPCTYGTLGKPFISENLSNLNEVLNRETTTGNNLLEEIGDIWTVKRLAGKEYHHATSKPPKLHEKAILRCTKPGDIILDSFLGSGSTLIAGEYLKRRVYGVELEPVFCDLIIKRWEKITGHKSQTILPHEKA